MTILLAGDIGGTNTTLRLVRIEETEDSMETLFQASYLSGNFPDLVPVVQEFLKITEQILPSIACFSVAGPVTNHSCQMTNLNWFLNEERLARELGIKQVHLLNDFAAVSHGILGLKSSELETLQPGIVQENAPIGVIGAGTGLGEGFIINSQVFATEGGHADFAPRSELEFKLHQYLQSLYKTDHVSTERVVSGRGIVAIYKFLRDRDYHPESAKIAEIVRNTEAQNSPDEPRIDPAAVIAKAALEKKDKLCEKTMEIFVEVYGAEAGNIALKLLPYGGLYIAGGIAPKILPLLKDGRFLSAFQQKGRVSNLLQTIPLHIVLNFRVGLLGSILYALKANNLD